MEESQNRLRVLARSLTRAKYLFRNKTMKSFIKKGETLIYPECNEDGMKMALFVNKCFLNSCL